MRTGVIGSRGLMVKKLERYLPQNVTENVSGGAKGIDSCAKSYALAHGIKITEILPEYSKYGRSAPLWRNIKIVESVDLVLAFWDGISHGTKFVIDYCHKKSIPVRIFAPRKAVNTTYFLRSKTRFSLRLATSSPKEQESRSKGRPALSPDYTNQK